MPPAPFLLFDSLVQLLLGDASFKVHVEQLFVAGFLLRELLSALLVALVDLLHQLQLFTGGHVLVIHDVSPPFGYVHLREVCVPASL